MKFPFPLRPPLLLAASLSAGIASGWALRQGRGNTFFAMPPAAASGASGADAAADAGGTPVEPFSMDRFRAALGLPMHRMLARVLPTADAALVRALAEHLAARPEFPPDPVWQAIFARWVKLDAPAALAWARTVERKEPAETAIGAWAEADLEAALAGVNPVGLDDWMTLCSTISETDPKRAWLIFMREASLNAMEGKTANGNFARLYAKSDPLAALGDLKGHYPDQSVWQWIATGRSLKDPDGCRDWLAGLQPPFKGYAISGLEEAKEKNPAAVAKILGVVPLTDETREMFLAVSRKWAEQDAPAALAWVKQMLPEGPSRDQALAEVAWTVREKDLSQALAIIERIGWNVGGTVRSANKEVILPENQNGSSHADFTEDESYDRFRRSERVEKAKNDIIRQLGLTDPEGALRYIEKADPAGQSSLLRSFVPDWFSRAPDAATRWLESLPPDKLSVSDLTTMLVFFPGLEPEAAWVWAQRLPPGPLQQALAGLWQQKDSMVNPAAAVEALPFTDPASRGAALDKIIRDWSTTDPRSALDRLVREPTPLPETCEAVVEEWTLHDPTAASTWVAAQAPGPNRDAAIKGLAASLTDDGAQPDFPAALMWSLSMTDPAGRLKTAQSILKQRNPSGPEAVEMRSTLETTTVLLEPERRALLQLLNP